MIPASLREILETRLAVKFLDLRAVSGGDIHRAARLEAADGRSWFVKYNNTAQAPAMFRTEAQGLALLGAPGVIATPRVYGHGEAPGGYAYLLLEYVAPGHRTRIFWETFGRQLADLHGVTAAKFGFAHDNFIGSLPQSNTRQDSFVTFYAEERLWPQMLLARESGRLSAADEQALDRLCRRLASLLPEESPALIHGDLWSGNFLCNTAGAPVLIDPAASFAHREMDLAMAHLFGGFDAAFFSSYQEYWPTEPGLDKRLEIYQLYYLLVHVNLFGGGYVESVRGILERWAG